MVGWKNLRQMEANNGMRKRKSHQQGDWVFTRTNSEKNKSHRQHIKNTWTETRKNNVINKEWNKGFRTTDTNKIKNEKRTNGLNVVQEMNANVQCMYVWNNSVTKWRHLNLLWQQDIRNGEAVTLVPVSWT